MNIFAVKKVVNDINSYLYQHLPDEHRGKIELPFKKFEISKVYAIDELVDRKILPVEMKAITKDYTTATNQNYSHSHNPSKYFNDEIVSHLSEQDVIGKAISSYVTSGYNHETLMEVVEILRENDEFSCLVGGAVRDMAYRSVTGIGLKPKDFDFVTCIPYDELKNLFEKHGFTVNETGKKFLVMMVSKDGETYEIANFRKDGTYTDGRRPESVSIGSLWDDAERRDFTVNSLYFSLAEGIVIDPSGLGISDMLNKTLRFVGKPEDRIEEDSLRVFRFYRFVSKGYEPEKRSLSAVRKGMEKALQSTPERVVSEIERIVKIS